MVMMHNVFISIITLKSSEQKIEKKEKKRIRIFEEQLAFLLEYELDKHLTK